MERKKVIQYYEHSAEEISRKYEEMDMSDLWDLLAGHFQGKKRILEIGTGSGRDASYLMRKGFDVTGVDGSGAMIREAERLHPELKGKILQAPLPDEWPEFTEPFEGMFSIATLMHFSQEEIRIVLERCRRDLLPGAPVLISVSGKRNSTDDKREFLELSGKEWSDILTGTGYDLLSTLEDQDVSGRDMVWYTFLLKSRPA